MVYSQKTKIVATIGPNTANPSMLKKMYSAGMSLARLNGSHNTLDWHESTIKLINASNKLKLGKHLKEINNTESILNIKTKYSKNKKLAILYTNHFLKERLITDDYEKFNNIFNEHKKKDDLADAFLQGLYYIENK